MARKSQLMPESHATDLSRQRNGRLAGVLAQLGSVVKQVTPVKEGVLVRMVGLKLEAAGCQAAIGSRCQIIPQQGQPVEAEVVGFSQDCLMLMPEGKLDGIKPGSRVIPIGVDSRVEVDEQMLGRIMDGAGKWIDGGENFSFAHTVPLHGEPINPLQRRPIRQSLDVGVRCINALMTIGRGQRMGLFAGSGVGKSSLLGMMTRNTEADVVVVALVGERGREVREFIEDSLGREGLARAIVVATPADDPPLKRVHGAWRATAIAEYFRAQGKDVLLLMDSLTRFAQAQREIGLAVGEPPVTKGYPPSVFSLLPQLVERAGNGESKGSITAIYTVLVEGDDTNDPISDAARAILDGHIHLSREIADSGIFPAIDIEASVSRSMQAIACPEQMIYLSAVKQAYSTFQKNSDLIAIGAYESGTNPDIDNAIHAMPFITAFVQQDQLQKVDMPSSLQQLEQLNQTILTYGANPDGQQ